jgi:hypothetical protein
MPDIDLVIRFFIDELFCGLNDFYESVWLIDI